MNSQFHDEFVALGALYFSGEISEEEWALLQIHMACCDSCHDNFLQYQHAPSQVIPAMAKVAAWGVDDTAREPSQSPKDAENSLIDSSSSGLKSARQSRSGWHLRAALIAVCALSTFCLLKLYSIHTKVDTAAFK